MKTDQKPINNSPQQQTPEPPFLKIFGKSKLARIFAVVFLILIFLFLLTSLKTYILGLVVIFLPLFLGVVSCSIVNPIAKFFSTTLKISYRWFTYLIYFIFLLFILFLILIISAVFIFQWNPFIISFLGSNKSIGSLLKFLDNNKDTYFTSIIIKNNVLTIVLDNTHSGTFSGLGVIYLFMFKIIHMFISSISVNTCYAMLNWFYTKVAIYNSGPFFLIYKLAPILLGIGMVIAFTIFITVVFLNKYNTKISKWFATKFWEDKSHQKKVETVFNKSIKSWALALVIDEAIIFSIILLTVILAGNLGGNDIFRHSFIIFPIFMVICCLVPIIGPIIGTIPMVIVSILQISSDNNYASMIIVLVGVAIAISLEAFVISPLIYSKTTKLNIVTVLLGISVFGLILGIWAMPFAVPLIMMFKEICNQIYNFNLKI
ncbi:AI-2E family transporter [Mycoplasma sp. SG1]|uniref:AI-2E family transporter n=1 Tax=Mycoplasma sp. SG1 TaxID=2810348 RepID=UPI002024761B|nr:AI-2E family transporter [Mycoplasma sp. SG1]URM53137.1 AI-2E family transporter [Mycoplasma sp. SG1]